MLMPIGRNKLMFVVVGTGRCGTVFFSSLLSSLLIPCSHERVFTPKGLSYAKKALESGDNSDVSKSAGLASAKTIMAEASYMAVPYLEHSILKDATIIHAVRHPADVILSFNNKLQYFHHKPNKWERFILSHMPGINGSPLEKNCYYVVHWNRWIEKMSYGRKYIRIRLEYDIPLLLEYLKMPNIQIDNKKLNSHDAWSEKKKPLLQPATREDVMTEDVRKLAKDYGY